MFIILLHFHAQKVTFLCRKIFTIRTANTSLDGIHITHSIKCHAFPICSKFQGTPKGTDVTAVDGLMAKTANAATNPGKTRILKMLQRQQETPVV